MGSVGTSDAFGRLLEALEAQGIRYLIIGMSAAIAQGVMGSTLDIDVWIDLPPRQYMHVQNIARKAGAVVAANTVVYLEDGRPVNFIYQVTGLDSFESELRRSKTAWFNGRNLRVLGLQRIQHCKQILRRDKDLLHLRLIADFLKCRRKGARRLTARR